LPLGGDREHGSQKDMRLGSNRRYLFQQYFAAPIMAPWVPPFVAFLERNPKTTLWEKELGSAFRGNASRCFSPAEEFKSHMDQLDQPVSRSATPTPGNGKKSDPLAILNGNWKHSEGKEGIPYWNPVVKDLNGVGRTLWGEV